MKPGIPFLRTLIGNRKAFAEQHADGTYTPVRRPITNADLAAHLRGTQTFGTYVVEGDKARTLVFDIDDDDKDMVRAIARALVDLGFETKHVGNEFSGRKGYHIWVVAAAYVPAAQLRRIGRAVADEAGFTGEVFPKQDEARDLGNLIKLPGGIHRVTGKPNNFQGPLPRPVPVGLIKRLADKCPEMQVRTRTYDPAETPFPCMGRIQAGVGEGSRNRATFHLAVMLRRGGLSPEYVETVIRSVAAKHDPPLDSAEVDALLRSSEVSGPICRDIPEGLHCGDQCITAHGRGLGTRSGKVRYAAEGEGVVFRVASRDEAGIVVLEHEDVVMAKAALKSKGE